MSAAFSWDDHPIVTPPPSAGGSFNWDDHPVVATGDKSYLDQAKDLGNSAISKAKEYGQKAYDQLPTGRGFVQGTLNQLPAAGTIGGGIIGGAGGTLAEPGGGTAFGAMGGAALGNATGQGLKNLGEQYLLGKDKQSGDYIKDEAGGLMEGAGAEMGGQVLGKAGGLLSKIGAPSQKAQAVEEAAKALGVKPTTGMTSDSYMLRNTENSLSQRPTVGGMMMRSEQKPINQALQSGAENLTKDATGLSPVESGNELKKGLISDIGQRQAPISMAYDDVANQTKNMSLEPGEGNDAYAKSIARISKNIRNIPEATVIPGSPANKVANDFADALDGKTNVDQIKQLKSAAGNMLGDRNTDYQTKAVAGAIKDKLDMLTNNTIMRQAIQSARTPGEGQQIGSDIVNTLKGAAKEYRGLRDDLTTLSEGSGITNAKDGISSQLKDIDSMPPEKMTDALFKTNDSDFLNFLKEKHPEQFETARQAKLAQIYNRSTGPDGELAPAKLMQSIKNYTPEARGLLFGDGANEQIGNMETVRQSIPGKVGASDTPRGESFNALNYLNPMHYVDEAGDLAKYGLLKAPYSPIGKGLINASPALKYQMSKGNDK